MLKPRDRSGGGGGGVNLGHSLSPPVILWLATGLRITLNETRFMKDTNVYYLDPMFMFNKCGEVLGTSDISWMFI